MGIKDKGRFMMGIRNRFIYFAGRAAAGVCAALGIPAGAPSGAAVSDLGGGNAFAFAVAAGVLSAVPPESDCGDEAGGRGLDSQRL